MQVTIVNYSVDPAITPNTLTQIACAIQGQVQNHYASMWEGDAVSTTVIFSAQEPESIAQDDIVVGVFDAADQPGALGWHDVDPQGHAYAKVFWGPVQQAGGTLTGTSDNPSLCLSAVLSHEILEAILDPFVNAWHDVDDGVTEDSQEACDRVENDAYLMDGTSVYVSNFLSPLAFRDGPGPYDWMELCTAPFEIRPGGYAIRRTGGPSGTVNQVFGAEYADWRKKMRDHDMSRFARRSKKS